MNFNYFLFDNGGCSNIDLPILLPLHTIFRHEYGKYEVKQYTDEHGNEVEKLSQIKCVSCEKL